MTDRPPPVAPERPPCDHQFNDSRNCAKCDVHVDTLRAESRAEWVELMIEALDQQPANPGSPGQTELLSAEGVPSTVRVAHGGGNVSLKMSVLRAQLAAQGLYLLTQRERNCPMCGANSEDLEQFHQWLATRST